jgi:hypothetical protein
MELLLRGLGCVVAAYGAAYLITGILLPGFFLDVFAINDAERRSGSRWRVWLRIGLTALGLGLFFYAGAYAIFKVIPADWGNFNEDGDWEYTRGAFQMMFAGYATLMLITSFEERVEAAASRDILVCKLQAYRDAVKFCGSEQAKLSAAQSMQKALTEMSERSSSDFVRTACADELRFVELTIRDLEKSK